jgi:hypothetical protein
MLVRDFHTGATSVQCNTSGCQHFDTLQQIGWFDRDKLCYVLNINSEQIALLKQASEKYGCDGAELLERMAVDCLGDKK